MRRRPALALLSLALLSLALLAPSSASAHAELVASSPAANASLTEPPAELWLTFSEQIDVGSLRVRLLDPQQAAIDGLGDPVLDDAGITATLSLPALEPGIYTVDYQVTSAVDGHVTRGIFAFLLDPTGTQPAPAVRTDSSSLSSEPDAVAARWIALLGALALAGSLIFWLASARPALAAAGAGAVPAPWSAITLMALLAVVALVIHLALAARPIVATADGGTWFPLDPAGPFGWTQFAIAMRVAVLGLLAAALLSAGLGAVRISEGWRLNLVLVATVIGLAGMSFAAHAAARGGPAFALVDLAHLLAVAAWLGTLAGLLLLVRRAPSAVGVALRRHSRMALLAAPLVVLTGIANSPLVLGAQPRELLGSGYGNLLLGKAMLFSIAVGIGAVNFMLVRRHPRRLIAVPLIFAELTVAAAAVLVAAGMVTGQPAAGRVPELATTAIGTAHLYGTAGESHVHAAINLPAPGEQRYQVSVADVATGAYRTDVQRVFLVFSPPDRSDLPPERVQLQPSDEPWLFGATGAYTPVVGSWQVQVIVRRVGRLDESAIFPLAVAEQPPPQQLPPPDTGIGIPPPLALLWRFVPGDTAGWAILASMLGVGALLFAAEGRRRLGGTTAAAWLRRFRTSAVVLTVVAGIGVGSQALVTSANAPPAAAAARPNPVPAAAASIARGRDLYLANCSTCHGVEGAGEGPTATELLVPPRPLPDALPGLTDGAIAYRIANGTVGTLMPPFAATLSDADAWDVVNYLRSRWPR